MLTFARSPEAGSYRPNEMLRFRDLAAQRRSYNFGVDRHAQGTRRKACVFTSTFSGAVQVHGDPEAAAFPRSLRVPRSVDYKLRQSTACGHCRQSKQRLQRRYAIRAE